MKLIKAYAGYNIDQNIRFCSSSGAIFSLLAENVLLNNGVVYGVRMAEDCYSAGFTRVMSNSELSNLRGSKYLQAKVGDTYKKVKEDLLSGRKVLFSGTGCQVNGLKNYLRRDFENLLCVDVICHGTPSPALWRKYAKFQEKKNGGKLKSVNFRCKKDGWIDFGIDEVIVNKHKNKEKRMIISKDKDVYMQMFLRDYCLRPSCYNCIAKKEKKADLTIADFWGIEDVASDMNDGFGTSLILVRTEKGDCAIENIKIGLKLKEVSYEEGVRNNPAEYKSCSRPLERMDFFEDMNNMEFSKLQKKYVPNMTFIRRGIRKSKNIIKDFCKTKENSV